MFGRRWLRLGLCRRRLLVLGPRCIRRLRLLLELRRLRLRIILSIMGRRVRRNILVVMNGRVLVIVGIVIILL